MTDEVVAALVSAPTAAVAALAVSLIAARQARKQLRGEFGTQLSAEAALRTFLSLDEKPYRSFPMIQHHIGGFSSNELRRLLVRAGAARFIAADGTEMWALVSRVEQQFRSGRWQLKESPGRPDDSSLFPGAFDSADEY